MNGFYYFFKSLPWLGFFAAILLAWIFYLKARNKERMALIEKGADVSEIYSKQEVTSHFPWLKLGIIITGISIGVLLEILLFIMFPDNAMISEGVYVLMIVLGFFFGGIAMIISHFIDKPRKKE